VGAFQPVFSRGNYTATVFPFFWTMCEQVCTRVFLKKGADLSIFVSQKDCLSCNVLPGFMLDKGLDLGPLLMAGPKGYLPD